MQAQGNEKSGSRWFQRGVIVVVVVGLLIGGAFAFGNSLRADTPRAADVAAATTELGMSWECSGGTGSTCIEVPTSNPDVRWMCSGGTGSTCVEVTTR